MQAVLDPTQYAQAFASLRSIDEALVRARDERGQVGALRREAAFLSGLLQSTTHHDTALDLCDELAAQPVELEAVQQVAHVLHTALCTPTPA